MNYLKSIKNGLIGLASAGMMMLNTGGCPPHYKHYDNKKPEITISEKDGTPVNTVNVKRGVDIEGEWYDYVIQLNVHREDLERGRIEEYVFRAMDEDGPYGLTANLYAVHRQQNPLKVVIDGKNYGNKIEWNFSFEHNKKSEIPLGTYLIALGSANDGLDTTTAAVYASISRGGSVVEEIPDEDNGDGEDGNGGNGNGVPKDLEALINKACTQDRLDGIFTRLFKVDSKNNFTEIDSEGVDQSDPNDPRRFFNYDVGLGRHVLVGGTAWGDDTRGSVLKSPYVNKVDTMGLGCPYVVVFDVVAEDENGNSGGAIRLENEDMVYDRAVQ